MEERMFRKLLLMLKEPEEFFEGIREEGYREPFIFLLQVSAVIAFFTPIVNYLGWPSTDRTSTYQAQIVGLALVVALFLAGFLHLIFRALGGQGAILNAWKAICYGVGPCVLLGWMPYWTLFVGAWSFVLQLYFGPKVLYRMREGRALLILAFFVGATLLEFAIKGTTVGFGGQ
jgi:hypothetical protein